MTESKQAGRRRPPSGKGKRTIGGGNPLDDTEPTPPVSPLAGAVWTPGSGEVVPVDFRPAEPPAKLPALSEVDHTTPELHEVERHHLEISEQAIESLRTAFAAAGEGLAVIRSARLYRGTHGSFEEYCQDRWELTRRQVDRLIAAAPLAQKLRPIGLAVNEGQVRELLPVADQHGQDAAVTVYRTIAEADGVKVTAAVIKGAVRVLPDAWDEDAAVARVRAYLAGEVAPVAPPVDPWVRVERFRTSLRRFRPEEFQGVDAAARRELATELRALADQMEADA